MALNYISLGEEDVLSSPEKRSEESWYDNRQIRKEIKEDRGVVVQFYRKERKSDESGQKLE